VRADVTITGTIPSTGQVDVNDTVGRKTERIYVLSADAKADWRVTPAPDDGEYTPIP
jgi:hypothetical protein